MTTLHKALIAVTVAAAFGIGTLGIRQTLSSREQPHRFQTDEESDLKGIQRMQSEQDAETNRLANQKESIRQRDQFINVGIGGGGAMFVPACSPHDHKLMFVACDMGGVYRTVDGGESWNMLDNRQLRRAIGYPVQFHPTDPNTLYAIGGGKLFVSHDRGGSFTLVLKSPPWRTDSVVAVCVNAGKPFRLLVGAGTAIYVSEDDGENWTKSMGSNGRVIKFLCAGQAGTTEGAMIVGTTDGVFSSDDNGHTWRDVSLGLPGRELRSFCGGRDAITGQVALFCTLASKVIDGKLVGGIFRSLDRGRSWQSAVKGGLDLDIRKKGAHGLDEIPQYEFAAMAETRPNVVYVTVRGTGGRPPHHFTVYRSDDFGDSWRSCFTVEANVEPGWVAVDLGWGWGGPALGFSVCSSNPDVAMFTNNMELYVTRDGGKSWHSAYSQRVVPFGHVWRGEKWRSSGLEVTTCWQVVFDPHDQQRAYICYTDIGFARSGDRGKTWQYSGRGSPWRNTWYAATFDPMRPGVIYGACSDQHDIPTFKELDPSRRLENARPGGGVCISQDFGESWQPLGQGLPKAPATSLVLDPSSRPKSRTIYVTMFGHGVFKSTDSGASWQKASQGLGSANNMHAYLVKLHRDGTLFCTVTGRRDGPEFSNGSGLYRSLDGGENWQCISPPLKWAGGFDFDPRDSKTVYLTASTPPRFPQGGLYKTSDGGASWRQLVKDGDLPGERNAFIHSFFVTLHPKNPNTVYLSVFTHGLFISDDAGLTWREFRGIPFTAVQQVTFDPVDENTIWVTTHGGGVWKGPAQGF